MSVGEAQAFIKAHGGTFRKAAQNLHPDHGGDPKLFKQLVTARDVLRGR